MSAYVHWIKPRLLSASASKGGKSLLLHLCARSRFLIPMIVLTAFWVFDAQMQFEASISLTLNRNVRIIVGAEGQPPPLDAFDDDGADDDETYSADAYSEISSDMSDMSDFDNISSAIQDFVDNEENPRRPSMG